MKKHIAFKIMLPLIVIFILTVTVNVSTTSQFQSFREVCVFLADQRNKLNL